MVCYCRTQEKAITDRNTVERNEQVVARNMRGDNR